MHVPPEGILLIDKPKGITSFDLVRAVRRKTGAKKVGHAGTLDPLAHGLMVVGVNDSTKELKHYIGANKVYEAEICIGERSATGDAEGPIIETQVATGIPIANIKNALKNMRGVVRLEVSIYSATKRGGEALYKKARRGEKVTPPQRDMEVLQSELLDKPTEKNNRTYCNVRFTVGSGTYIRSLAEELGRQLGYPARLENLCRTQVGNFTLRQATEL